MNFISHDSRCFSFDHRANGYGRGEGFGVIVLKRLTDAIEDGDTIRAVVRATGSNQDGRTPGITQPSADSQARLIRETHERAGLDMGLTRYVEAHGTGTAVSLVLTQRGILALVCLQSRRLAIRSKLPPSDPHFVNTGAMRSQCTCMSIFFRRHFVPSSRTAPLG